MTVPTFSRFLFSTLLLMALLVGSAHGADTVVDLVSENATDQWVFSDSNGRIEKGELVLDGRLIPTQAYYLPSEWTDVSLKAKFFVEPQDNGVLACGFVVRATDGDHFYYVHFDRGQAILCRSD